MRPRPTLSKPLGLVCLAPAHLSATLPFVSFQSLTNCPRFATHSEPLSSQPITDCPICKSFALIIIQQCRGWVGPLCSNFPTFQPANLSTFRLPHTLPTLCFQSLTSVKFCNSFVLTFIQNARGVYVSPFLPSRTTDTLPHSAQKKGGIDP